MHLLSAHQQLHSWRCNCTLCKLSWATSLSLLSSPCMHHALVRAAVYNLIKSLFRGNRDATLVRLRGRGRKKVTCEKEVIARRRRLLLSMYFSLYSGQNKGPLFMLAQMTGMQQCNVRFLLSTAAAGAFFTLTCDCLCSGHAEAIIDLISRCSVGKHKI
jgi:hypothetical protein